MNWSNFIRILLMLLTVSGFVLETVFYHQSKIFREFEIIVLTSSWLLFIYLTLWCSWVIYLNFRLKDLFLIGLILISIIYFLIDYFISPAVVVFILLIGIILGKISRAALSFECRKPDAKTFLIGLIFLLTFSSWCHLDMPINSYNGPRWMGLWDNPNTYGILMGVGVTLAVGLQLFGFKINDRGSSSTKKRKIVISFLFVAIALMGTGLILSFSRGAWLATSISLTYLFSCYSKFKWQYVTSVAVVVAVALLFYWGRTTDSAPWYVKRVDLGRPSAQNRVTAWLAGLEIMRDHPLGLGWNKAMSTYQKNYSPPEGGPAAITTNDYLIIGTELGFPALVCFVMYVWLCFRRSPRVQRPELRSQDLQTDLSPSSGRTIRNPSLDSLGITQSESLRAACLAGALVFVVAFWFDGGLFKLPTAAMFWVLLELGAYQGKKEEREVV